MVLIWANEHTAWWAPAKRGYTRDLCDAGKYTHAEAEKIVDNANRFDRIEEYMVEDPSEEPKEYRIHDRRSEEHLVLVQGEVAREIATKIECTIDERIEYGIEEGWRPSPTNWHPVSMRKDDWETKSRVISEQEAVMIMFEVGGDLTKHKDLHCADLGNCDECRGC